MASCEQALHLAMTGKRAKAALLGYSLGSGWSTNTTPSVNDGLETAYLILE